MNDRLDTPQAHLLRCHLAAFVPLMIQEFLLRRRVLVLPHHDLAGIITAHGDAILHCIPGQTARAVSALVEALATLAFVPGGVNFLDLHFEVPPRQAMALLEEQGLLQPSPPPVKTGNPGPSEPHASPTTFEAMFRRRAAGGKRHGQA